MNQLAPVQERRSFPDKLARRGVTLAGKAVLRLRDQADDESTGALLPLNDQSRWHLRIIGRLIEGARLLSPLLRIEPQAGEAIMTKLNQNDYEEPVQVRLASDVYFEISYDEDGNRIFSLRAEPKESPLVEEYVADLAAMSM
jgi:hypothetical protein